VGINRRWSTLHSANLNNNWDKHLRMPNIFSDIREKGYVIFSLNKANLPNYYPSVFNEYPGVNIHELKIYDLITIKVFMADGDGNDLP
jgi:hypothetical protein